MGASKTFGLSSSCIVFLCTGVRILSLYAAIIPARYITPLLDLLRGQPVSAVSSLLHDAEIEEGDIRDIRAVLTISQFDKLVTGISAFLDRNDLGFELGQRISIDSHQALGLAMRNCSTVDQLLRLAARFSRLLTPSFFLQYRRDERGGGLFMRPAALMSQTALHAFEELFAVTFQRDCVDLLGRKSGVDIYLSMPAPTHIERYERLYPTRFHFAALPLPEVRCVLSSELLDRPLSRLPETMPEGGVQGLQSELDKVARAERWSDWVSLMLREAEGCQPSRAELASLLNISQTSLTRNLAKEGVNLRTLGNQIRHQRACTMLRDSSQSVGQIAYRLGYSNQANFCSAFHLLSGVSPRRFRQNAQAATETGS